MQGAEEIVSSILTLSILFCFFILGAFEGFFYTLWLAGWMIFKKRLRERVNGRELIVCLQVRSLVMEVMDVLGCGFCGVEVRVVVCLDTYTGNRMYSRILRTQTCIVLLCVIT